MSVPAMVKVLIVDDHKMFVDGLIAALQPHEGIVVVATAATGDQALGMVEEHLPDVILLDQLLPDEDGIEIVPRMFELHPAARIIIISQLIDAEIAENAVRAGCAGYLTKDKPIDELIAAIRTASAGEPVMSQGVLQKVFDRIRAKPRPSDIDLSHRELEVLQLMAEGLATPAIAKKLSLSLSTVRNHVYSVIQKLGVHSKLQAVVLAIRDGLIQPPRKEL